LKTGSEQHQLCDHGQSAEFSPRLLPRSQLVILYKENSMAKQKAAKRELIDTGRDKRYVRRDDEGKFKESDDVGRSLSQDKKRKAKTTVEAGQGDRGDQKRRGSK
jgi:hypothetical protein